MKKSFSFFSVLFLLIAIILSIGACDTSGGSDDEPVVEEPVVEDPVTVVPPVTVYTAGYYLSSVGEVPCYWKGPDQMPLTLPSGAIEGFVRGIQVVDGTVYTVGKSQSSTSSSSLPCYWVGTTPTTLPIPAGAKYGEGNSIFVSGGVIYTAGSYDDAGGTQKPCYWTGTTQVDLPVSPGTRGCAYAVCVSGGKVYVSGCAGDTSTAHPCYWVDGVRTDLSYPAGSTFSYANSIAVSDGVVYTGGTCDATANSVDIDLPCYWINVTRTDLSVPTTKTYKDGRPYHTVVAGGKVYTSGTYGTTSDDSSFVPCYWTDTTRTDIPVAAGEYGNAAFSISVSGADVYMAGYYQPSASAYNACFWKGTERTTLSVPSGCVESQANCIWVQ